MLSGLPLNASSDLVIEQAGESRLEHDPDWDSEPWKVPFYWDLRLTRRDGARGWSLDLMHHKLVLRNRTDDIQWFSISHGYNLLTLQRRFYFEGGRKALPSDWHATVGAGVVIAHPESEIRGQRWDEQGGLWNGEYLSGLVLLAAAGREWSPRPWFALNGEARVTLSRVTVDIEGGDASLTHAGLHLLLGVSLRR